MELTMILVLASGLAMDACAVSLCNGLNSTRFTPALQWTSVFLFALFQGLMLLLGALLTSVVSGRMAEMNHWIAMIVLVLIGLNMIREATGEQRECCHENLTFKTILGQAIATSLDAFAAGAGLSLVSTDILTPVLWTAAVTGILCAVALKIGKYCEQKLCVHAQRLGGILCILIGIRILFQYYF